MTDPDGTKFWAFEIATVPNGRNNGRRYQLRLESSDLSEKWVCIGE